MAIEKKWERVSPQLLTSNGTSSGQLTVADPSLFKVKQKVKLFSNTMSPIFFRVNRITSPNIIELGGAENKDINDRSDLSAYLVADNASISADEQERPAIPPDAYERAVYEEEPVVAKRVVLVDQLGRKYTSSNPIPTSATFTGNLTINLDGTGPTGDTVGIVGVDGVRLLVNPDGSIDIDDTDILAQLLDIENLLAGTLDVNDSGSQAILSNLFNLLDSGTISVDDSGSQTILNAIATALTSTLDVSDGDTQALLNDIKALLSAPLEVTFPDEPLKIAGTENGLPGGTEFTFVNNRKQQILAAKDRDQIITYADFGTKDQRVVRIDYVAPSIGAGPGFTARKDLVYVLDSGKYRRTNITWSIV